MKTRVEIAMNRTSDGSIRAVLLEADGPHAGGAIELARASLTTGCACACRYNHTLSIDTNHTSPRVGPKPLLSARKKSK